MPYKEKEIEKLYYSIGEVAEMFHVSKSLLRFWETEFTVLRPRKNQKGTRLFTKKDIETLKTIYHLVKEKGYTLEGAKKKLKESSSGEIQSTIDISEKLKALKTFLIELEKQI